MAQLSTSEYEKLLKRVQDAQKITDSIVNKNAPSGAVLGASTTGLNSAQMGGASGIGFESGEDQDKISDSVQATIEAGGSKSQTGDSVSSNQASTLVKSSGLEGIIDSKMLVGKTIGEASRLVEQEKTKRTGQISTNTSFSFNPETLSRTQRAIDKFGFALDDISNDPFEPKDFKDEKSNSTIEITSKEIGNLFNSAEDLYNTYNTNQQFKDSLDKFITKGGSLEGISKNITAPVAGQEGNENQTPAEYLASLSNPSADPKAQQMAIEELAPESEIAQNEISRLSGIPKELQTFYFGDEKTMGMLQMRQEQSQEKIRLIEEQEKDAKRTVRERAELTIDKNRAEMESTTAKIEENRLTAKNYMTAQLAKLGALNTTGAAPLALQTLETKYQSQVTNLENSYKFAEREIQIGLSEDLDDIENQTTEAILNIEEDLTLDNEKSFKEVMKARQDAEKQIYTITEQYGRRLRERTTKYTDSLKKEAEAYAKKFASTASNGLDGGPMGLQEGQYVDNKGILLPNGTYLKMDLTPTQETEVESAQVFGADTIKYFISLPTAFRSLAVQEAQGDGKKFSTIDVLKSRYAQWKKEEEDKKNGDDDGLNFDSITPTS